MTGIGILAFSNSINNLDTKLSSLTFDNISGIVPTTKGGTGTSDKTKILSSIGF